MDHNISISKFFQAIKKVLVSEEQRIFKFFKENEASICATAKEKFDEFGSANVILYTITVKNTYITYNNSF